MLSFSVLQFSHPNIEYNREKKIHLNVSFENTKINIFYLDSIEIGSNFGSSNLNSGNLAISDPEAPPNCCQNE